MPRLRMSSGGGVAAEYMTVVVSVVRQVGEGFVHCIVGVSWEVWPYAMSVIVVMRVTAGGGGQTNVERIPQRPVCQICETKYASLTKKYLTRPVIWTVPEPRPTPESSSSALTVLPAEESR